MAKPRKKSAPVQQQSTKLLDALRFLSLVTKDIGTTNETHVYLGFKWAIAYNGVVTAAQQIDDDIYCCPHNKTLIEALSKCGQNLSITQLDINRLSIKSDKFKVIVPCIDPTLYHLVSPDDAICSIDDNFKTGLEAVNTLVSDDATRVELGSILMNGKSLISSNGVMIFEYWHGCDLPPKLSIPKAFANVLTKSTKKLKAFGYSQFSITIYFEDDSWIKTQLYSEQWPDTSAALDRTANAWPVPASFWEGIAAVQPFSPDGLLHFRTASIASHADPAVGASYEVPGVPDGPVFAVKQLLLIKPYAETVDFMCEGGHLMFYGKNIRGVIAGRKS